MKRQANPTLCKTPSCRPLESLEDRALAHVQGGLFQQTAAHGDGTKPTGIYV